MTEDSFLVVSIHGGLGNQLFQYAIGLHLSKKYSKKLVLDISSFEYDDLRDYRLSNFNIEYYAVIKAKRSFSDYSSYLSQTLIVDGAYFPEQIEVTFIQESSFNYKGFVLNHTDNFYLQGYWQADEYFREHLHDVLTCFKLIDPLLLNYIEKFSDGIDFKNSIGVHVRRGDGLSQIKQEFHGLCSADYYKSGVQNVIEKKKCKPNVYVFSDDFEYCVENFQHLGWTVINIDKKIENSDLIEFFLLSKMQNFVLSNSTFSWWSCFLSQNDEKISIFPYPWFTQNYHTPDIYPEKSIRLNRSSGVTLDRDNLNIKFSKISVILSVFKRQQYIEQALNSVLNQTFSPHEILIVSNGGSVEVGKTCEQLSKLNEKIHFINMNGNTDSIKKNDYLSTSRNIGIKAATGDWIAFIDDDDLWLPTKLEEQITAAILTNSDVVSCRICHFNQDGIQPNSDIAERPNETTWRDILTIDNYLAGGSSVLVRRSSIIEAGLFDENLRFAEDHEMWWRLSLITSRIMIVDKVLVKYRLHRDRMTEDSLMSLSGELAVASKMILSKHLLNLDALKKRLTILNSRIASVIYNLSAQNLDKHIIEEVASKISLRKFLSLKIRNSMHYKLIKNGLRKIKLFFGIK